MQYFLTVLKNRSKRCTKERQYYVVWTAKEKIINQKKINIWSEKRRDKKFFARQR